MLCGPTTANGVVSPLINTIVAVAGSASSPSITTTCTAAGTCVCTIDGQACTNNAGAITCPLSYTLGSGAAQAPQSYVQFDAWASNAVSAAEIPNVGKTVLTALLCWSYTTYPPITSAVTLLTGDTVTIRARTPGKDDQSQTATISATNTFVIAAIGAWAGTGTNLINQPNVLLYYKTPAGTTYFSNSLAFTFSNSLTMAAGNFVAVYASTFTPSFTVTATDATNKQSVVTTVSTSSTAMIQ